MSVQFVFVIICVSFVQFAAATTFKDCGTNAATLKSVSVSNCPDGTVPCPLKQGTHVSLSVQLTPTEDSKALTTSIHGIIDGVKVPFPTETDACKSSIKCPVSKGMATTFAMSLFIEPSYPKLMYITKNVDLEIEKYGLGRQGMLRVVVEIEVKTDDGKSLICAAFPAEIIA